MASFMRSPAISKSNKGTLPNLIIIGAAKCGTTTLHASLDRHPDVFMSEIKELNYFSGDFGWSNANNGLNWYSAQFSDGEKHKIRGESSVSYSRWDSVDHSMPAIYSVVPNARLIFLVRDPIERIKSAYSHLLADPGWPSVTTVTPLNKILSQGPGEHLFDVIISGSRYGAILNKVLEYFSSNQLLVASIAELRQPDALMRKVCEFLCIQYHSELFSDKIFANEKAARLVLRNHFVGRLMRLGLTRPSRHFPQGFRRFVKMCLLRTPNDSELTDLRPDEVEFLRSLFDEDIARHTEFPLRELVGWK